MTVIDLSKLPAPKLIEEIDYQEILQEMLDDLSALDPTLVITPTDPAYKILEVAAYREMIRRQRDNEKIKGLLAAYAVDTELDHIGITYYNTQRLVVVPGDDEADPPILEVLESDEDYLRRMLLAPDGQSNAGPRDGYVYIALSADGDVLDATASTPAPTEVMLTVLSRTEDGTASQILLDTVKAAASAETVRPQTDLVQVQSAQILSYEIVASLEIDTGPDSSVVLQAAQQRIEKFTEEHHRLGKTVVRDAALAALYVDGVRRVTLDLAADIVCDHSQAPFCSNIEVTLA